MGKRIKIILDTDIGDDIDDAFALGLVLASPEIELVGITTVFRNIHARSRQARTILTVAGREDVPVAAGCGDVISPRIEIGNSPRQYYLDGVVANQDASSFAESELSTGLTKHGVDFLVDTIMQSDGDITVVTIGPMTNLAMALIKEPKIASKIKRVLCMAGVFDRHLAEWNVRCDPVAAQIVLNSTVPVDMVGLDVTSQVAMTASDISKLKSCERPMAVKMAEALGYWEKEQQQNGIPILHDPLAIGVLIDGSLLTWKTGRIDVELEGRLTYGFTRFTEFSGGGHRYACTVDAERFMNMWISRITAF
jgi:purine nucleosidase